MYILACFPPGVHEPPAHVLLYVHPYLYTITLELCTLVFIAGQYYETMVRYEKFFILETQYIPGVLVSVVSDVSADATDIGSTTVHICSM